MNHNTLWDLKQSVVGQFFTLSLYLTATVIFKFDLTSHIIHVEAYFSPHKWSKCAQY